MIESERKYMFRAGTVRPPVLNEQDRRDCEFSIRCEGERSESVPARNIYQGERKIMTKEIIV